jgi:hypothetical protein
VRPHPILAMPSVSSIFGLASMQVQFFSLMSKLSIPWPNEFRNIMYVLDLANLDPRAMFRNYDWPVVDFRLLFILVANIVPLMIALMMLILFQPLYVVFWYFLTAGSFVAIITGLVLNFSEGLPIGVWFSVGGGFLFAISGIVGITVYCVSHMDKPDEDDVRAALEQARAEKLAFNCKRTLLALLIAGGGFFGGCVLTGLVVKFSFTPREDDTLKIIGFVLFSLAGIAALHFLIHLTAPGRRISLKVGEFFSRNFLMVMLVILSVSYVPAITYCLNNFMCADYKCPVGTKFNPFANRTQDNYETDSDLFCDACVFLDDRCRIGGSQPQDPDALCPAWSGSRIWSYPETPCTDAASLYFLISSCLVLPTYILLVPFMYVRVIRKVTNVIDRDAKLVPRGEENVDFLPPLEAYDRKINAVEPAAASMYQPYNMRYRYFSIPLLVFRLVIVVVVTIATPHMPQDSVWILMGIHVFAVVVIVFLKPFASAVEYVFTIVLEICDVINCVYAIVLYYGVVIPGWFAYVLLGINIVIPAIAAIITTKFVGNKVEKAEEKVRKDHAKERKKKQLQKDSLGVPLNGMHHHDPFSGDDVELMRADPDTQKRLEELKQKAAALEIPKGRALSTWEKKQVLEHNLTLSQALNQKTSAMVTKYFMIIGFILMCALGTSILGYLKHQQTSFRDGSSRLQRNYDYVFGGYQTWRNFTSSCCCITTFHPKQEYTLQERWICDNGNTVDRGRVGIDTENNATLIRGFCSRTFSFDVSVFLNGTDVGIRYWNYTQIAVNRITELARDLYW